MTLSAGQLEWGCRRVDQLNHQKCGAAGLVGDVDRLGQLYDLIDALAKNWASRMAAGRFDPTSRWADCRAAASHYTRSALCEIEMNWTTRGPSFTATNFALIQSELLPEARRTPLTRFPLRG